jgi:predicted SAM-dependent methyltransferase
MAKASAKLKIVELQPTEKPKELLKLDLGCGLNKREGFKGVDFVKGEGIDFVHDLFTLPWPFADNSVEEAHCSHFFEHVPHLLRGKFADELYRVLAPGGKATFITPYFQSIRATQDFTHEWPPVSPNSYLYFNKGWRDTNKLTHGHYDLKCDFDFTYGYSINGAWTTKAEEARNFAINHYNNVIDDLHVTLVSRKKE